VSLPASTSPPAPGFPVTEAVPPAAPTALPASPPPPRAEPDPAAISPAPAVARRRQRAPSPGRPAAGSIRDLQSRLDQLPDGHPSSPYEDSGLARPQPHRLKQLELGLPAPERDVPEPASRLEPLSAPVGDMLTAMEPEAAEIEPATADEDASAFHPASASDDAENDEAAAPDQSTATSQLPILNGGDLAPQRPVRNGDGRHASGTESWQDPYPAAGNGHSGPDYRPAQDGELSLGPWPEAGRRNHLDRTDAGGPEPLGPKANGHAGPGRHDAGAAVPRRARASHLSEDDGRLVAGLLAACQAAEGRNLFGEYGESGLTPAMRRIAEQLPQGGLAPGSESDALKSAERLAAKLARLITRHPGRSADELAAGIGDGVRYAFAFAPDFYTEGTWLVHRKLKSQGFELEARRNRWESPEYKGVWTRWRDPAHGLTFEVQFHTSASWDVVRRTHDAYRLITDPATPSAERARLRARQVAAAAAAKAPPHCAEISDFGRETR